MSVQSVSLQTTFLFIFNPISRDIKFFSGNDTSIKSLCFPFLTELINSTMKRVDLRAKKIGECTPLHGVHFNDIILCKMEGHTLCEAYISTKRINDLSSHDLHVYARVYGT